MKKTAKKKHDPLHFFAEQELKPLLKSKDMYGVSVAKSVLQLIDVFSKQEHSGASAMMVLGRFDRVARFRPLGPLTGKKDEWMEVTDGLWQNKRCSSVFKDDKGKAWDIDAVYFENQHGVCYTNKRSHAMGKVKFPYTPPTKAKCVKVVDKDGHGAMEWVKKGTLRNPRPAKRAPSKVAL